MKNFHILILVTWMGFVGLNVLPARSQVVTCTLTGTVFDPTGSAVSQASVTAKNTGTDLFRAVTTDAAGRFTFTALPPGNYAVMAVANGFAKQQVQNINLEVGQTANWDVHLTLGAVTQEVSVEADPLRVQSESSSVGQVINEQQMTSLPLNGRSFVSLASLGSGNVPAYQVRSSPINSNTQRPDLAVHISGGRGDANSFLIDGVESRAYFLGQPGIQLSLDTIQEFRVQKNDFEARYGKDSGVINLVTKSGSNSLHGSAYEYIRNDVLDAANYFDNFFGTPKSPYRQNQFGASLGGPIKAKSLFFFGSYEGFRVRQGNVASALVPTPAQLSGDLSDLSISIINPFTGQPFAGNIIPSDMLSPAVQRYKQYIPAPNANSAGINYVYSPGTARNDDQATGRIDWNIRKNDTLFGRYTYFKSDLTQPGLTSIVGNVLPMHGQNIAIEETHIFTPTLINLFKLGYNRSLFQVGPIVGSSSYAEQIGIANANTDPRTFSLPLFDINGYATPDGRGVLQGSTDNVFQITDEVDWTHGRHSISFGADIRPTRILFLFGLNVNGDFEFDGRYSGSALADFLLGTAASATLQQGLSQAHFRSISSGYFFQDDFRVSRRLTLNLGLRYEYTQPYNEINGLQGFFDTTQQRMVVRAPSSAFPLVVPPTLVDYDPSFRPGLYRPDRNNWAPRVGFAYSLGENSVLRGGYGIFYGEAQGQEIQGEVNFPPLVTTQSVVGSPSGPPNLIVDQLFPGPASAPIGTISPFTVNPDDRTPYVQQWNLGVQHTFKKSLLFEAVYVGSRGLKLDGRYNLNQARLDADPTNPTPVATRTPFAAWGNMLGFFFGDRSNYNGLQTKLEKRYSNGFAFLAGYTWSHSLDLSSQGAGGSFHQNTYNREADYASSDFDVRHRFSLGYTYELPFGPRKRFINSSKGFVEKLVEGWSVNGITSFMTGNYYLVRVVGDRANVGGSYMEHANLVPGCKNNGNLPHGDRTVQEYFNTACFVIPPFGTFGDTGRNIVEAPGLNNWDLSVIKNTPLTERVNAQMRVELFNAWNHAQFDEPDMIFQDSTFGRLTSARAGREIQLALRLEW